MKKISILLILIFVCLSVNLAAYELRQCKNKTCGQAALSDTWIYCPFCGIELPKVKKQEKGTSGEIILGNIFKSYDKNFSFERPNTNWKIYSKKNGVEDYNKSATALFSLDEEYFFMVIAENIPEGSLENYLELVRPSINNRITVSQENIKHGKLIGIRVKYQGEISGIPLTYYQTVFQYKDMKYQLLSWWARSNDNKKSQSWFKFVERSFKPLK